MSVVTGVMLVLGFGDEEDGDEIAEVQAWLGARYQGQQLVDVADHAGGYKHPQFHALAAGINYLLDDAEFGAFVVSRDWRSPENVVLILQPEEGKTRVYRPGDYGKDAH